MQLIHYTNHEGEELTFSSEESLIRYMELIERNPSKAEVARASTKGAIKVRRHTLRTEAVRNFWKIRITRGIGPMTWLVNCKATNAMIEKERLLAVERWPALAEMYPERAVKVVVNNKMEAGE